MNDVDATRLVNVVETELTSLSEMSVMDVNSGFNPDVSAGTGNTVSC
jgi:hypothetical protein